VPEVQSQPISLAMVVTSGPGYPTPTGAATLTDGSYNSAAATLTSGNATITVPAGTMTTGFNTNLIANYSGDNNYAAVSSRGRVDGVRRRQLDLQQSHIRHYARNLYHHRNRYFRRHRGRHGHSYRAVIAPNLVATILRKAPRFCEPPSTSRTGLKPGTTTHRPARLANGRWWQERRAKRKLFRARSRLLGGCGKQLQVIEGKVLEVGCGGWI